MARSDRGEQSQADEGWLLLIYRVPSEPTRLRATVWRRLKGLGAIYLQNSVAALPLGKSSERALRRLRHEIIEMQGSAVLMRASAILGEGEVLGAFQSARDDEYDEIVDKCADFVAGIDKEFAADHFTFAELEENEVDLQKLVSWLAKVVDRDAFGAPRRSAAEQALAKCQHELERYADRVYAEVAEGH